MTSAPLLWAMAKLFFDNQETYWKQKKHKAGYCDVHLWSQEAEAGGSWIWALSGLYSEMLSQTNQQKKNKTAFLIDKM